MRWPFRRPETAAAEPTAESAAVEAGASAPAIAAGPPAWATMPALQRTVHEGASLTAPSGGMLGDLAERWTPATTLEPLGHELGGLGPSGTIGLTGTPIEGTRPGPDLVDRHTRTALRVQRTGPTMAASALAAPVEVPTVAVLPPLPAPFRAPVVEPASPATVQRSLISAADPLGAPSRDDQVVAGAADAPSRPAADAMVRTEAAEAPVTEPATAPLQRVATESESLAPLPVRRLGLGAPLAGGRGGLPLQRSSAATTSDETRGPASPDRSQRAPRAPVQRLALGELPVGRPPPVIRPDPSSPAGEHPDAAAPPTTTMQPDEAAADPAGSVSAVPATVPAAVLTGAIDVSRLAVGADPRPDPVRVLARPLAGRIEPRTIQREFDAGPSRTTTQPLPTADRSERPGLSEAIQGTLMGTSGTPRSALTVARVVAHGNTTLPVQREALDIRLPVVRDASLSPSPVTVTRSAAAAGALPLARALSAPPPTLPERLDIQRATDDGQGEASPLAGPMPAATAFALAGPAAPHASAGGFNLAIQRAADDPGTETPPPAIATSTPGGGGLAGGSDKDLDELARRLYDRIRRRLSRELLADRERAGMLTDLR